MDVIDELIAFEETVDLDYVERRILDWEERLNRLYNNVIAWLPADWRALPGAEVLMHEDLMQRANIPPRPLPCLLLEKDAKLQGKLEPRSLWIIGANGRVDLGLATGHYLIVDRAENFAPPAWIIAAFQDRMHEVPLTRESFRERLA